MRRLFTAVMLGGIILGSSPLTFAEKEWTIMVYMAADNDLEEFAIRDMNEMEMVGSTSELDIVVQLDRIPGYDESNGNWTSTRRYHITQDAYPSMITSAFVELGELNMGDANTLYDFVAWAMYYYPANHYFLIIWNHGQGWLRLPPAGLNETTEPAPTPSNEAGQFLSPEGVVIDPSAFPPSPFASMGFKSSGIDQTNGGDQLYNYEVAIGLSTFPKLDIIGFDACFMGMIEVGYELRDCAQYMVASEELEPGDGWFYDDFLYSMAVFPSQTASQVCSTIVLSYYNNYLGRSGEMQTLSAVDLSKIQNVVTKTDNMVNTLAAGDSWPQVMAALPQAERFSHSDPYYDLYDILYDIADLLSVNLTDPIIVSASNSLKSALSDAVIINRTEAGHPYAHGLSIYFPQELYSFDLRYTQFSSFADSSDWCKFLGYYFGDGEYIADLPEPNDVFTQAGLPLDPAITTFSWISSIGDVDWWLINSGLSETVTITLNSPPDADLDMKLFGSDGTSLIDSATNRGNGVSDIIVYSTPGEGYYYLAVSGHNSFSTSPYQLQINETGHNSGWFRLSYDDDIPDGGYFSYTDGDVIGASFSLPQYPMTLDRVWINFSGIAGGGSGDGSFYLLLYDNYGYVVDPFTIGPLMPPDTGWAYLDLTEIEALIYTSLFVGVWYDGINTPVVAYDDHPSGRDYFWNAYTQNWEALDKSLFIRLDVSYPSPTGVFAESDDSAIPGGFAVAQNYPNPFNASTVIEYETHTAGPVTFDIYNILGQRVYEHRLETQAPGSHTFRWNGQDQTGAEVPSGIYFYRVSADGVTQSRKMVLLK